MRDAKTKNVYKVDFWRTEEDYQAFEELWREKNEAGLTVTAAMNLAAGEAMKSRGYGTLYVLASSHDHARQRAANFLGIEKYDLHYIEIEAVIQGGAI